MPSFTQAGVTVASSNDSLYIDFRTVRVDERGLFLDAQLMVARADIAAVAVELEERTMVAIRT